MKQQATVTPLPQQGFSAPDQKRSLVYKPEIDGLRAVGVLLVLFCHMQLGMAGGFVGVDIFFVISGFLITSILLKGIPEGKFSFWGFYGRRFVRLYPALIIVTLITFLAAFLLLESDFLVLIARTGKYAITSTANMFFSGFQGYFHASAQKQVFLHTWSLGVEWQFYIIWPFIVWLALKHSRKLLLIILIAITAGSLFASQWMINENSNIAYYHMPYRAFELGMGGLLVFFYQTKAKPWLLILLAYAGLAAIFATGYLYSAETLFPGFAAFIPCLGAVAFIYGGQDKIGGALLRLKPIVYIGKISYSVYLVHWPLMVIYRSYVFRDLLLSERITLAVISLLLGSLLYHSIETKISWRKLNHKLISSLAMIAIVIASTAGFQHISRGGKGLPWRVPANELSQLQYTQWGGGNSFKKHHLGLEDKPTLAVISGDSFAGSLASGLDLYATENNMAVELQFAPGCVIRPYSEANDECSTTSIEAIKRARELEVPLVLVESWGAHFSDYFLLKPGAQGGDTPEAYQKFTYDNLDAIHEAIGNIPLILVGSVPYRRWGGGDLECLLRPQYLPQACTRATQEFVPEQLPIHPINEMLQQYAHSRVNVYYIDTDAVACPDGVCSPERSAQMYSDGFHVSINGSRIVGAHVIEQIKAIITSKELTAHQNTLDHDL